MAFCPPSFLCLLPSIAVFSRWHTYEFAEDRLEVVGIIITALHGYGGDALFRGEQQILGFRDTQLSDVLHGRTARAFLENM